MVGNLVRQTREARGMTQTELALRAGLRQTYISQVEGGEIALPRDHNLDKLGGALGLSRGDFYRAAGMLDGLGVAVEEADRTGPPSPLGASDDGPFDVARIIAYVKQRPGRIFQQQVAEEEARLSHDEFAAWCLDVFAAWMSNSNLALRSLRRGREERASERS